MYYLYILYSQSIDKFYIGYSSDPARRLKEHNHLENTIWTKRGQPWELKTSIPYEDMRQAIKAERKLKKLKSRRVINQVIASGRFY